MEVLDQILLSFTFHKNLFDMQDGPQISLRDLCTFQTCVEGSKPYSCNIFRDRRPSTVSVSILVMVEMFNALNALSENGSLFHQPPWSNPLLLGAIGLSIALHCFILYFPSAASLFAVTGLSSAEWGLVLKFSFPVILLDEILKFVSRRQFSGWRKQKQIWSTKSAWRQATLDKAY